jgi:hypothetical protein
VEMSERAPAYCDPALNSDALKLVALREEGIIEETLATEKEREMPMGKGADLTPPRVSSLASPHRPKASDGAFDAPRREYIYMLNKPKLIRRMRRAYLVRLPD